MLTPGKSATDDRLRVRRRNSYRNDTGKLAQPADQHGAEPKVGRPFLTTHGLVACLQLEIAQLLGVQGRAHT